MTGAGLRAHSDSHTASLHPSTSSLGLGRANACNLLRAAEPKTCLPRFQGGLVILACVSYLHFPLGSE